MEDKKSVFDYIKQLLSIFGTVVLIIAGISYFIGDEAQSVSSIFSLGSGGISLATLMQFLLLSVVCVAADTIFNTDLLIKNMPLLLRNLLFFTTASIAVVVMVLVFDWFPVGQMWAWISFIICFVVCTVGSTIITRAEERAENKKMQDALNRLKK